jgi:hypothetical protein
MAPRYINGVWVDDEEQQPGEEFAGVIDSETGEYTPAIPDAYDSSVSAEGFSTDEEDRLPITNNVGPDAVVADPDKAATAADAKVAAVISTRTFGDPDSYPGVKLYPSEQKQVERLWAQEAAAKTRFNQLSLAGGKDDEVEGHVAQAILAFAPIVAGYMLGGNELGAYGAKLGVDASKTYEKKLDTRAANKKKLTQAQQQMLLEDSQDRQKKIDGLLLAAERRNNAPQQSVDIALARKKAGVADGGDTNVTVKMENAASVDAAKEFVKQKLAANTMLSSSGLALDAIQNYLAKRPEARGENFAEASIRNIKDSITNPQEAALLGSALSFDKLNAAQALIRGVVSDTDQEKIDEAYAQNWRVPLETMEEVVKAIGRRLLLVQEQNRMMMEDMQSPDGWRAPSPAEADMRVRLGVAPAQTFRSAREELEFRRQQKGAR